MPIGIAIFIGVAIAAIGAVIASAVSQNATAQATAAAQSAAANNSTNNKDHKPEESKTLIGIKSPALYPTVLSPTPYVVTTIFDSTTFPDKCRLIVKNETGYPTAINDFSIRGLPIYRYAGNNGYKWEYFNHADIEENGEKEFKVSNNYITNAEQCEDIGDFYRKELEPHDMYTLTLNGCHPYFKLGDRYELNIDYQLPTEEFPTELISVDVEIRGVMISRSCDNIGQTVLSCRVPYGEWNNTTNVKARWISSGLPFDRLSRTTEITIAAYDFAGQADIYCDGVNDDIEIQDAIDKLSALGGGEIKLTIGTFYLSSALTINQGVVLSGQGDATILSPKDNTVIRIISAGIAGPQRASNLSINGNSGSITFNISGIENFIIRDENTIKTLKIENINIKNYRVENASGALARFLGLGYLDSVLNCSFSNISSLTPSGGASNELNIIGAYSLTNAINLKIKDITITDANKSIWGIIGVNYATNCSIERLINTSSQIVGVLGASGIFNSYSTGNSGNTYFGFQACSKIIGCTSITNIGVVSEYGFYDCKSAQQNKSDDTNPYVLSYADAGTSNACADTAAGGYNS